MNKSVHLMTSVNRERIVSKNICGNFDFTPLLKSYDSFKNFVSYHTSKNTAIKLPHQILSKWYEQSSSHTLHNYYAQRATSVHFILYSF